jgi:hypothetical protein
MTFCRYLWCFDFPSFQANIVCVDQTSWICEFEQHASITGKIETVQSYCLKNNIACYAMTEVPHHALQALC